MTPEYAAFHAELEKNVKSWDFHGRELRVVFSSSSDLHLFHWISEMERDDARENTRIITEMLALAAEGRAFVDDRDDE